MWRDLRGHALSRTAAVLVGTFLTIGLLCAGLVLWLEPPHPIRLHVRWTADVDDARRMALERELRLTDARRSEGTTFAYQLDPPTPDTIRAVVQHPNVDDTEHVNRIRFRPEFEQDRERRSIFYGLIGGSAGAVLALLWLAKRRARTASTAA